MSLKQLNIPVTIGGISAHILCTRLRNIITVMKKGIHRKITWLSKPFRVKFYIISHDLSESPMTSENINTNQMPRIMNFFIISHNTGIANQDGRQKHLEGDCTISYRLWSNNDDNEVLTINSGQNPKTFPYRFTDKGAQTLLAVGGK